MYSHSERGTTFFLLAISEKKHNFSASIRKITGKRRDTKEAKANELKKISYTLVITIIVVVIIVHFQEENTDKLIKWGSFSTTTIRIYWIILHVWSKKETRSHIFSVSLERLVFSIHNVTIACLWFDVRIIIFLIKKVYFLSPHDGIKIAEKLTCFFFPFLNQYFFSVNWNPACFV